MKAKLHTNQAQYIKLIFHSKALLFQKKIKQKTQLYTKSSSIFEARNGKDSEI